MPHDDAITLDEEPPDGDSLGVAPTANRNPADLRIVDVDIPSVAEPGDHIFPTVEIENQNTQPAPGEEFDAGWVVARAGGKKLVHWCAVIRPNGTAEAGDCSIVVTDCADELQMPASGPLTVEAVAGGIHPDTHCTDVETNGTQTDSMTVTVNQPSPPDDGDGDGGENGNGGGGGDGGVPLAERPEVRVAGALVVGSVGGVLSSNFIE